MKEIAQKQAQNQKHEKEKTLKNVVFSRIFCWDIADKRYLNRDNCEQKVSIQLAISAMNIITGINKMNDGDKNRLNIRTSKNNSWLYSNRVQLVNKNATTSQNEKNTIIVTTVKITVLLFVRSKGSITRYALKVKSKKIDNTY